MYQDQEIMQLEDLEDGHYEDTYEDFEEQAYEDYGDGEDFEDYEDLEGDYEAGEADPFIGKWARRGLRLARKVASGPLGKQLKALARKAATAAGGAIAGPAGAQIAGAIANKAIRESDFEGDFEEESDLEGDFEAIGGDPSVLAEMDHYANLAAETEDEAEADQFLGAIAGLASKLLPQVLGALGESEEEDLSYEEEAALDESDQFLPLIPMAASLLPKALPMLKKALPLVGRGIRALGRFFRRRRRTRPAIRAIPRIAARTVTRLARQPIRPTPKRIAAALASQAVRTVANPKSLGRAMSQARAASESMGLSAGPTSFGGPARRGIRRGRPRRIVRPRYCVY